MHLYEYESRLNRPVNMKLPEFHVNERLKHLIVAQQLDTVLLAHLGEIATFIRRIGGARTGRHYLGELLSHHQAMLYFTQPSTRTFLSFVAACQLLGMKWAEIRDPAVSSEVKGESELDSVRMFSSFFDVVVIRSNKPQLAECCAYLMNDLHDFNQRNVPIINAGSGADEHPTQALLDLYTLQRSFTFEDAAGGRRFADLKRRHAQLTKGLGNKHYCFCGDIGRGRTIRSLALLLSLYPGNTMSFIAPDHIPLRLTADLRQKLTRAGVIVLEHSSLNDVIGDVDMLYMTRVQHEHDSDEDKRFFSMTDLSRFWLTSTLVKQMKEYAPILHPFPRNQEVPLEIDTDSRAMYFRQARNGMWIRAALLAYLFDVDGQIATYHQTTFSEFHNYNV